MLDERELWLEVHTSGPHVAVRVTHQPTGLVGEASGENLGAHRAKQQALADLEQKVAAQRAGKWTARYARHMGRYEEPCESLAEAVNYLYWGEEGDALVGLGIIGPDGHPVDVSWEQPVEESHRDR